MSPVSVVIPLAPGEQAWVTLIGKLILPEGSEIILAAGNQQIDVGSVITSYSMKVVNDGLGRAGQMNAGAAAAQNDWLWFLHADTLLDQGAVDAMKRCVEQGLDALFFFDLKFSNDGPSAIRWNEWAVEWRAGSLGLPFGDQAFLMRRDLFERLGGYREDVPSGEDHYLLWKAHQMFVPVLSVGAPVFTSARKYRENGWLSTTLKFIYLTIKQAVPQWFILQKCRLQRLFK